MSARLANYTPGPGDAPQRPGDPFLLGLRSTVSDVLLGTVRVETGLSALHHQGVAVLPELDPVLRELGLGVELETSERRRPRGASCLRDVSQGSLRLTKMTDWLSERSVYELSYPVRERSSVMAHVRLKKGTWTCGDADWTHHTDVAPVFLGLEHGTFNTGFFVYLRDDGGTGSICLGGPLTQFGGTRAGALEAPFAWKSLPLGTELQLWLRFNQVGRPSPFAPAMSPLVEVWTQTPSDAAPVLRLTQVVGALGQFVDERSPFSNRRSLNDKDFARLFLGNLGTTNETVEFVDWTLYPDWRTSVLEGEALPDTRLLVRPNGPVTYRARDGQLPTAQEVGRWRRTPDSLPLQEELRFNPGQRRTPVWSALKKGNQVGRMLLEREEPRLLSRSSGALMELFFGAESQVARGHNLGMGFGLEDGERRYQVTLLDDGTRRSLGLVRFDAGLEDARMGYFTAREGEALYDFDHRSLRLARLVVDRLRGKVGLYLDNMDAPVLEEPLGDVFAELLEERGRFFYGHPEVGTTQGSFNVASLRYLPHYAAWEGRDGQLPSEPELSTLRRFTKAGTGTAALEADQVGLSGDVRFERPEGFSVSGGFQVDFRCQLVQWTQGNAVKADTAVGLRLYMGHQVVQLGFFACGLHGLKVGFVPGAGGVQDLLEQSELGRAYSTSVDFTRPHSYRLVYRAYEALELWVDSLVGEPALVIPWKDDVVGFDLPLEADVPASLVFGHFAHGASSTWDYLRWGRSSGHDVSVRQLYPMGLEKHLFAGRSHLAVAFSETYAGGAGSEGPGEEEPPPEDATPPEAPPGFFVLLNDPPTLAWGYAGDDVSEDGTLVYRVWLSNTSGSYPAEPHTVVPAVWPPNEGGLNTATLEGLAPGTYYAQVTARDEAGNESEPSAEATFMVGSAGSWVLTTAMPSPKAGSSLIDYGGHLYSLGGAGGAELDSYLDVKRAPLQGDNTLGAWAAQTPLPAPVGPEAWKSGVWTDNQLRLNIATQVDASGNYRILSAPMDPGTGELGAWSSAVFAGTTGVSDAILTGGPLSNGSWAHYRLGGNEAGFPSNTILDTVYLQTRAGVGAWSAPTEQLSLPTPMRLGAARLVNTQFLFVIGLDADSNPVFYRGDVAANGMVQSWTSLPWPEAGGQSPVFDFADINLLNQYGVLHVFSSDLSAVWRGYVEFDGSIPEWGHLPLPPLNVPRTGGFYALHLFNDFSLYYVADGEGPWGPVDAVEFFSIPV